MPASLKSRFPQIMSGLPLRVNVAMRAGAEAVAEEARMRVPVDTGTLRDAIHVRPEEGGWSVVAGDREAFYGHIVENGSVHTAPHPFLVPALESQKAAIQAEVNAALRKL